MHAFANPARFLRLARPLTVWLLLVGVALATAGAIAGLTLTPPDYLQGETVRILYIHVPAAWLGMAGWAGVAAASVSQVVWRHPLAAVAGRAIAPAGAAFAAICLVTGSIWGRPTWGTWWEWDGRLTSMLILFFLYLGYIALAGAERERGGEGRIAALYGLVGAIIAPGPEHFVDRIQYRPFAAVAAAADNGRLHKPVRRHCPDVDAGGARGDQGRGADSPDGRGMNPWPFVIAAYGIATAVSVALTLWAFVRMRRAEAAADEFSRR